jgi:hypothetical protein
LTAKGVLGSNTNHAIELKVNGTPALRIEPAPVPNLIGGDTINSVSPGVRGGVIAGGGGGAWLQNKIHDDFSFVGGGLANQAGDGLGTTTDATAAVVAGGYNNQATAEHTAVGGGSTNVASGPAATIAGGNENQATAAGAAIGGGTYNVVNGVAATVGGGWGNQATQQAATVGGGTGNYAQAWDSTVAGGSNNVVATSAVYATIAGGTSNDAFSEGATVGGGYDNNAYGGHSTVGGGTSNSAGSDGSTVPVATVAGGYGNWAQSEASFVGGGYGNRSAGSWSTISGGAENRTDANHATIAGGYKNYVPGKGCTVGGGKENWAGTNPPRTVEEFSTVGGGRSNMAWGEYATIGGGELNQAVQGGTVPGGRSNTAVGNSFAAGTRANADRDGCFVWGDNSAGTVTCGTINRWVARTSGGAWFYSNSAMTTGVKLAAGAGTWTNASDRNLKHGFAKVDVQGVLKRVAEMPVSTWSYKSEPGVRHMGPMAQDFYAAFALGTDDKGIATVDADGVMLAAIKGLNQKLESTNADFTKQLDQMTLENKKLHVLNQELWERLDRLEAAGSPGPVGRRFGSEWGFAAIAVGLIGTGLWTSRRRQR